MLELFRALAGAKGDDVDLIQGALLIAQNEYPGLDGADYRIRLDQMGAEAQKACRGSLLDRLAQLSQLFAGRWHFRGNRDDYYDPRNSFLNDVLDRRTGIPITLSIVYIEIGRLMGLDLMGIGMPGHFLVGCAGHLDIYVDAFSEGALLTRADCAGRLRGLRPDLVFRPEFLDPVGPRAILTRVLHNLLGIYLQTERFPKALGILEMILCLEPGEPAWLRSRALVHYHLKNYSGAIADLKRYLEGAPDAADHDEVTRQLASLHHLRGMVN